VRGKASRPVRRDPRGSVSNPSAPSWHLGVHYVVREQLEAHVGSNEIPEREPPRGDRRVPCEPEVVARVARSVGREAREAAFPCTPEAGLLSEGTEPARHDGLEAVRTGDIESELCRLSHIWLKPPQPRGKHARVAYAGESWRRWLEARTSRLPRWLECRLATRRSERSMERSPR